MSDVHDVIEAFIDGERVDPALLKQALADEAGRDLLIDVLVLRSLVAEQAARRPVATEAPPRSRVSRLRLVVAAAGIAGLGLFGGYLAGSHHPSPAAAPAGVSGAMAPAPTHIIRLENGVDWNEKVGG
ncbi:MAG TPA: hypothetical protein VLT86_13765 [Vicinamibacterales bacterium]|nr:hypothetical protein [Vicinamibacterales bacterium]